MSLQYYASIYKSRKTYWSVWCYSSVCIYKSCLIHVCDTRPRPRTLYRIRNILGMVYEICVTKKFKYARHLYLATIVMTLRFCTCINSYASMSFIQYKVRGGTFDEPIKVTQITASINKCADFVHFQTNGTP